MLLVIYGLTLNVGDKTRNYLKSKGFKVIKKAISEENDTVVKSYFVNRELSDKKIIEQCDFKYKTNYGYVGFNNSDIFNAIYGEENALLAMTCDNIDFFHHIKTGYGEAVPIIATYIDEKSQNEVLDMNPQISKEEREKRLATGKMAAKVILNNGSLFDDYLIYGGEDSAFNLDSIETQLDNILNKALEKQKQFLDKNYVQVPYQGNDDYTFLSYSHNDKKIAMELLAFLQFNGIRVWYDAGIPVGDNWMNVIADKIKNASSVILLSSSNSTTSVHVNAEINTALRFNKKIVKLNIDDSSFDPGIEMYFYGLNQVNYQTIDYSNKKTIINTLKNNK